MQVPQSDHHDDGYNPTNYYRTSMDGKKLHASGNSADDLTELAQPQPKVCLRRLSKFAMPSAVAGCRLACRINLEPIDTPMSASQACDASLVQAYSNICIWRQLQIYSTRTDYALLVMGSS